MLNREHKLTSNELNSSELDLLNISCAKRKSKFVVDCYKEQITAITLQSIIRSVNGSIVFNIFCQCPNLGSRYLSIEQLASSLLSTQILPQKKKKSVLYVKTRH